MPKSLLDVTRFKLGCSDKNYAWTYFRLGHVYIFEKDMRSRVPYISKRYSKANSMFLKSYDSKQESKQIYLDMNNLYGFAMSPNW